MDKRHRIIEVDKAKGLAIFLVVVGHIISGPIPAGNEWFDKLTFLIYKFHMPFFMFLSGFTFFYTLKPINNILDYKNHIIKKAKRLIPGYLIFALLILFGKYLASYFFYVDDVKKNISEGIIDIFIDPSKSAGGSLWYIYTLFGFFIIFPILLKILKNKIVWIIIVMYWFSRKWNLVLIK